jgi:CO/xanthine dehydrogenase FAD-binding subunit
MEYVRPRTIDEALSRIAGGGVPLAGGTAIVPAIVDDSTAARTVVDIGRLDVLRQSQWTDDALSLGSMVSLARIAEGFWGGGGHTQHEALAKAAAAVGNPQIRRVATIGGNLALGAAIADLPSALLVLDAEVLHRDEKEEGCQPIAQLLNAGVGAGRLITAVRLPSVPARRSTFLKFAWRRASGKTIINVAGSALVVDGVVYDPRLAVGGAARIAARLPQAERLLAGRRIERTVADEASRVASSEAVVDVPFPPAETYRRRLIQAGVRRILSELTGL